MAVALECNAKLQKKRDNENDSSAGASSAQLSYTIDLRQGYRWIDLDPANHPDHLGK